MGGSSAEVDGGSGPPTHGKSQVPIGFLRNTDTNLTRSLIALRLRSNDPLLKCEPVHEISNNVVDQQSLRSACAYAQSDQSLCLLLEFSMIVKLLTEHNFEFLSLKGGCRGSSESTHVKMPHCWKSHALAH